MTIDRSIRAMPLHGEALAPIGIGMNAEHAKLITRRAVAAYHTDEAVAATALLGVDVYVDHPEIDEATAGMIQRANAHLAKASQLLHDAGICLAAQADALSERQES